ncbi:MAG TPA: PglZ domain-containing protein [Actinobacteria bacterium]|nr:PglZ domain-containing protein [Actinomycetota bacterium]
MSHVLHDYLEQQLARHLDDRRVVVWFDPRAEFTSYVRELSGNVDEPVVQVEIDGREVSLAHGIDSLYELRSRVEHLVEADEPQPVVIYLPHVESGPDFALKELELAGRSWTPQLRKLARNALRVRFTDGVIDELLAPSNLSYVDIVAATAGGGNNIPSVLKTILAAGNSEVQLASWLANPALDHPIVEKEATTELAKLVSARLDVEVSGESLTKWRSVVARYVLATEFRSDLKGDVPKQLAGIPRATKDVVARSRVIADRLREAHPDLYPALADQAASELSLSADVIDPLALGAIDTFRFEERALLDRCGELLRNADYEQVLEINRQRRHSFWLIEDVERQAQWEAIGLAAHLGLVADEVTNSLKSPPTSTTEWVLRYAETWHRLDRSQRKLEAWLPKLEHDPDERAIIAVRDRYDEVVDQLAVGFVGALKNGGWEVGDIRQQAGIFDDLVKPQAGPVAFFMVDAMRYEMGVELAERLEKDGEVTIEPAVGVLPSITPTGMAALMPGASSSYEVVAEGSTLAGKVDGSALKDLNARKKHVEARVPSSVDVDLAEVMQLSRSKLRKKVHGRELVVIRSQEIDFFGEGGFASQARPVMDTVVDNLARAIRKLAGVGIVRTVVASDHGHLFAAEPRAESMRIDAPGGDTVDLHRRCWVGRGGATPPSCVRVSAQDLGYDADFDLVFPEGAGVFRAGGDLAFHHGGPSLQELVIPVITFRASKSAESGEVWAELLVSDAPEVVTNRMFSVKLAYASLLGSETPVRPVLLSDGKQVGAVGMVFGAEEQADGAVLVQPGSEASIGFMLQDDTVESLRIVILDPATDAELYRSPADIPIDLGVG